MTTEEQKKIFSRNLRKYMDLNQKQQIDVASQVLIRLLVKMFKITIMCLSVLHLMLGI